MQDEWGCKWLPRNRDIKKTRDSDSFPGLLACARKAEERKLGHLLVEMVVLSTAGKQ
jgi:hypothetical protein